MPVSVLALLFTSIDLQTALINFNKPGYNHRFDMILWPGILSLVILYISEEYDALRSKAILS